MEEKEEKKPKNPTRRWCFTINNWTQEDWDACTKMPYKYMIIGKEKGEECLTPHLQGYVIFQKQLRFGAVKKLLQKAHLEVCRGSHEENVDYCKKQLDFTEFGRLRQGERVDLDEVRLKCGDEKPMREITSVCTSMAIRVAEKFLSYNEQGRIEATCVTFLYGPSGSGKSRAAFEAAERQCPGDVYVKNDTSRWWDGYDGHKAVIIDDWRSDSWPTGYTLALLDRYPFRVEVKGGYRQFKPTHIWITCINPPLEEWVRCHPAEPPEQFLRRLTNISQPPPFN